MNKFDTNVKIQLIYAYQHMAVNLLCKSLEVDYDLVSEGGKTYAVIYFEPQGYAYEDKDATIFLQSKGYKDLYDQIILVQNMTVSHELRVKITSDLLDALFDMENKFLKSWVQETGLLPSQSKINTVKTPEGYSITISRIDS